MATSTSLNLRALLKTAVSRTGIDLSAAGVSGLSGPARALYVAATAHQQTAGVVLLVLPGDADLGEAVGDIRFFLSALEGTSAEAIARTVLPFPSHEIDPYRGLAPHLGVTSARALALHALATGQARVVVTSGAALLPRVSAPERLMAASIEIAEGLEIAPTDLADLLADAGFTREDPVDQHGEFCVRGGIVDLFPAGDARPVRLEFVGDTIESIREFDPGTQRSTSGRDQVLVVPLRDTFGDAGPAAPVPPGETRASLFDYTRRSRSVRVLVAERDEIDAQLTRLLEGVQRSYDDAVGRGEAVAPPAELFVDQPDVERWLDGGVRLETLETESGPADAPDTASAGHLRHIACQPAVEMRGRIERLDLRGETTP